MILALDNALGTTGYAVFKKDKTLVYCDKFKTKSKGLDDKLNEITDYLLYLVERFEITHIVIEDTQSQSNKDTFKKLSILNGLIREFCILNELTYTVVPVTTWRKYLCIPQRPRDLSKKSAQAFVYNRYGLKLSEDECEAICIGVYYISTIVDRILSVVMFTITTLD